MWYVAARHRHFWNHTAMHGARFASRVTGGEVLRLYLGNFALVGLTVGLGAAWAITRPHAFSCNQLQLEGTIDWPGAALRAGDAGALGEALAPALDVDVDAGW